MELGYGKICEGIDFGGGAVEDVLYLNKRVEMADTAAKWFINGGVSIPDDNLFQKHLCCVPVKHKTGGEKWKLDPKETIIKNSLIDPHLFDAFILTFAQPIMQGGGGTGKIKKAAPGKSPLKTNQRRARYEKGDAESSSVSAFASI